MTSSLTISPPITVNGPAPVDFRPPLLNPNPNGLYAATVWDDSTDPPRFLNGVRSLPTNFVAASGLGRQELQSWCDNDFDKPAGGRSEPESPFTATLIWAADQCDMTEPSRAEVRDNVAQTMRLKESAVVEEAFAARLLADAATGPSDTGDLEECVSFLDGELLRAGFSGGLIHVSPMLAGNLANDGMLNHQSARAYTPLGNVYVFGAGYVGALGNTMIATTPTFGWRTPVEIREAFAPEHNVFYAMAERAVVVGYEQLVAAATLTT